MGRYREASDQFVNPVELGTATLYDLSWNPYRVYNEEAAFLRPWNRQRQCFDELHSGPPYRTGGPFDKTEYSSNLNQVVGAVSLTNSRYEYVGGFLPHMSSLRHENMIPSDPDWGDVSTRGFEGWNKYRPTKPRCSAGVAIAELKEVPRMLQKTALDYYRAFTKQGSSLRDAGGTWLNTHFGWLPFLNDFRSFITTASSLDKRIKQLHRDNGRWVKRGGLVSSDSATVVTEGGGSAVLDPILFSNLHYNYARDDSWRLTETNEQSVWFEARFRYYIPKMAPWKMKVRYMRMLYGLHVTPSMIYELTPWSWLVDWCSNTGDMLEFLSSMLAEDLCAKYAYIMGTTSLRKDLHCEGHYRYPVQTVTGDWYAKYERKMRVPASEFGFGLTEANFSSRQWSILGALGLSRLK